MTTQSLSAWVGSCRVGSLSYHDDTGRFSFEYEHEPMDLTTNVNIISP